MKGEKASIFSSYLSSVVCIRSSIFCFSFRFKCFAIVSAKDDKISLNFPLLIKKDSLLNWTRVHFISIVTQISWYTDTSVNINFSLANAFLRCSDNAVLSSIKYEQIFCLNSSLSLLFLIWCITGVIDSTYAEKNEQKNKNKIFINSTLKRHMDERQQKDKYHKLKNLCWFLLALV